jgi:uncharacterized protein
MTDAVLEKFIRQYIEASPGPDVYFTWHGGEPTLAGINFYETVLRYQKKYAPYGWNCINNLQTNGLLLDDKWCAFLAAERFDVGLSIDVAAFAHDAYRVDNAGGGTYARVAETAHRLKSYGVRTDLLCTVTPRAAAYPLAIYEALRNFDTGWIQFIPIVRRGNDDGETPYVSADSVSADAYGAFLCAIFDEWASRDLGRVDIQLFAETARAWSGVGAGLCWMAPSCGRVLIIERDGGVYSCDHYVAPEYKIGDINKTHLRDLINLPEQRRFGDNKSDGLPGACRACAYLVVCNGGCPKDRAVQAENGEPGQNYLCAGLKRFFAHAEQPLRKITQYAREGLESAAIMYKLRSGTRDAMKGVGRNDLCPCGSGKKAKNCCLSR